MMSEFNYPVFEQICQARVRIALGSCSRARRCSIAPTRTGWTSLPPCPRPCSGERPYFALYQLGEFEYAESLQGPLLAEDEDRLLTTCIQVTRDDKTVQERASAIQQLNDLGIKAYQAGELEQALGHFARPCAGRPPIPAPPSTRSRCCCNSMQKNRKSPEFGAECKETLEVLEGIPPTPPSRNVFASCARNITSTADIPVPSPMLILTQGREGNAMGMCRYLVADGRHCKRRGGDQISAAGTIPLRPTTPRIPPRRWSTMCAREACATACNWPAPSWRPQPGEQAGRRKGFLLEQLQPLSRQPAWRPSLRHPDQGRQPDEGRSERGQPASTAPPSTTSTCSASAGRTPGSTTWTDGQAADAGQKGAASGPGTGPRLVQEAEETYRDLRKASEPQGIFTMSGRYIQQELTMRRLQMPFWSYRASPPG